MQSKTRLNTYGGTLTTRRGKSMKNSNLLTAKKEHNKKIELKEHIFKKLMKIMLS